MSFIFTSATRWIQSGAGLGEAPSGRPVRQCHQMVHTDRVIGIALSAGPAAGIQRAMAQTFRLISVALFLSANNQEICSLVFQKSLLRHFRFGTSGRQSRCQILLGSERWDTTKYPSSSSRSKVLTIYDADVQQPDRKPARWWQNVTEVKLALAVFNEKIDSIRASERKYRKGRYRSDYSGVPTIPSCQRILRSCFPNHGPHGNHEPQTAASCRASGRLPASGRRS